MHKLSKSLITLGILLLGWQLHAEELVTAPKPLRECVVCHGVELMGNFAVDAPKLSGLPAWYLERQMQAFQQGWRGAHPGDITGMEMRPQVTRLTPQEVSAAIAYTASVPNRRSRKTINGSVQRGKTLYATCVACHGEHGEGIEALSAPPLASQSDWYLLRQLQYFKSGVRGSHPGDTQGAIMQPYATALQDETAIIDVVAYINSLQPSHQGDPAMKNTPLIACTLLGASLALSATCQADVTRYPLPGSDFPIAQAVEVTTGTTLIYHSGMTPRPVNPEAEKYSPEYWGDTEAQTLSVFSRLEESLKAKGLGFGDVIKMQVYLVGVAKLNGGMDFQGMMRAYRKYFGTEEQPNLPARSAFQVAGLAAPGMLVEIEVVLARP